jgi:hypothetical protein
VPGDAVATIAIEGRAEVGEVAVVARHQGVGDGAEYRRDGVVVGIGAEPGVEAGLRDETAVHRDDTLVPRSPGEHVVEEIVGAAYPCGHMIDPGTARERRAAQACETGVYRGLLARDGEQRRLPRHRRADPRVRTYVRHRVTIPRSGRVSRRTYAGGVLEEEPAPTRPVDRFARTTAGVMLSASMLGLRDALEGPRDDEPAIVREWAGEPPVPGPLSVRLDPDNPQDSIILVRPWLLRRRGAR